MWLKIEHVTRFSYDAPIREAYTEIRLRPRHRDGQRCSSFSLTTQPRGVIVDEYVDSFGNAVEHFDVLDPHDALTVAVRSEVWTPSAFADDDPVPSPLDLWELTRESRYVPLDGAIGELAATVTGGAGSVAASREQVDELMAAVRSRLSYEPGSTHVHTRADEALAEGLGVCQDFAHAFIGVCRASSLPARYVSGYLFDPRGNGDASATHAWVDVLIDGDCWVSIDPTHAREQNDHYVRVAVGRDYGDVPPTRGVYLGAAEETLDVTVTVSEL